MMPLLYMFAFGFLATALIGALASGLDRKVTARVQYRVGPPIWQPLIDIVKLLGKENLVPAGASRPSFFTAPLMGFSSAVVVSTFLWVNNLRLIPSFGGDLIVVLYLLMVPSVSLMMGGFASKNPLASIGASREMKLILGYELPFILALAVPIIKSGYSIRLGDIIAFQQNNGMIAGSLSGFLAFLVGILWMQAKLGLVPFDIAEAETEIVSGPLVEYSGTGLALFKLMRIMLLFILPFFLITLFLGGFRGSGIQLVGDILKYGGLVVVTTLIRNTNPRVRIDQAVRFFWGPVATCAVIAAVLAWVGF